MRSTGGASDPLLVMRANPEIETLRERIGELVRERQELRTSGADRSSLEQNRRQLVDRQWELGLALIQEHAAALVV
jgi:hypothetical protein